MITVDIQIDSPRDIVWSAITDIKRSMEMMPAILDVEIIEKPTSGLVGLKWQETREMFGQRATETMWITDAQEGSHYFTRAESHGSIYVTRIAVQEQGSGTTLIMEFSATPISKAAKVMALMTNLIAKRSIQKMLQKDLQDIKHWIEGR